MMSAFVKRTALAHRHFVGVLTICYGFLIGWIAAWFSVYRYSHRQLG